MTEYDTDFRMYTDAGNHLVEKLVDGANALALYNHKSDVIDFLRKGMKKIASAGHDEVYDTVVRECIIAAVGCSGTTIFDISSHIVDRG